MSSQMSSNIEDYLETIHLLNEENGGVRVKDIASALNITMPSVSGAIKRMVKQGLVSHPRYDLIVLTPKGASLAKEIYTRHRVIKKFLQEILELDPRVAEKDACRMEHIISRETLTGLKKLLEENRRQIDAS
ncbi:metal-dependent transcriptional regulator [bacterium]|nr:metal-dependent transcriptional regulator [bacterium]